MLCRAQIDHENAWNSGFTDTTCRNLPPIHGQKHWLLFFLVLPLHISLYRIVQMTKQRMVDTSSNTLQRKIIVSCNDKWQSVLVPGVWGHPYGNCRARVPSGRESSGCIIQNKGEETEMIPPLLFFWKRNTKMHHIARPSFCAFEESNSTLWIFPTERAPCMPHVTAL